MKVFVGHDRAEAHHDVFMMDAVGKKLSGGRLLEGIEGVARFHEMVAAHVDDPDEVTIATETDRGLFVAALVAAGYRVLAVNPLSTARYRERHVTSGAKSDPGDAKTLAELARVDGHNHRPIAGDSVLAEAVKVLARAHQSLIWTRQRQTNQLRSTLREFYPAALDTFDNLASGDTLAVLAVAPTPTLGRGLTRSKIAAALKRGGRQRRIEQRSVEIQTALRAEQLQAPPIIADAMGSTVTALVAVIDELQTQISVLQAELATRFEQHPDAKIIHSLPGLGMTLGARVLAEFGDDPNRYANAKCRKTTPARHPSPEHPAPNVSCSPDTSATEDSPMPATCGPSPRSPPAPEPASSTTNDDKQATPTTEPYVPSPTASSESSTAASATTPSTTNTPPRPTAPNKPLDSTNLGMSRRLN